jgi:hypothetical protein
MVEHSLRGKVAIVGIGETAYYKHGQSPEPEFKLALMAIPAAEDGGIRAKSTASPGTATIATILPPAAALSTERTAAAEHAMGRRGAVAVRPRWGTPPRPSSRQPTSWCIARWRRASSSVSAAAGGHRRRRQCADQLTAFSCLPSATLEVHALHARARIGREAMRALAMASAITCASRTRVR